MLELGPERDRIRLGDADERDARPHDDAHGRRIVPADLDLDRGRLGEVVRVRLLLDDDGVASRDEVAELALAVVAERVILERLPRLARGVEAVPTKLGSPGVPSAGFNLTLRNELTGEQGGAR